MKCALTRGEEENFTSFTFLLLFDPPLTEVVFVEIINTSGKIGSSEKKRRGERMRKWRREEEVVKKEGEKMNKEEDEEEIMRQHLCYVSKS